MAIVLTASPSHSQIKRHHFADHFSEADTVDIIGGKVACDRFFKIRKGNIVPVGGIDPVEERVKHPPQHGGVILPEQLAIINIKNTEQVEIHIVEVHSAIHPL
jgi:hypothetical protein